MTEHTNDHENPSRTPRRPEGQDTSDSMDDTTEHDIDTTAVLPAAATPPTQQIAQATQRIPTESVPEGEVHPAYGAAAARVQAEKESGATTIQDAPAHDDSDPLAPLRDPEPQAPDATAAAGSVPGEQPGPAQQESQGQPTTSAEQPGAQPSQPTQPGAQAAPKRGPRVGTTVWGLIVIAVGLGILAVAAGVIFDLGVALIVLLGVAGVILVAGSVISSIRRR